MTTKYYRLTVFLFLYYKISPTKNNFSEYYYTHFIDQDMKVERGNKINIAKK